MEKDFLKTSLQSKSVNGIDSYQYKIHVHRYIHNKSIIAVSI